MLWKDPLLSKLVKEIKKGKTVINTKTPYNHVELKFYPHSRKYILWLNGYMQFISGLPEKEYHYKLYAKPVELYFSYYRRVPSRVLVLGGGDGLGLRELLSFPVRRIDIVDIDRELLELAKNNPILATMNKRAFHDKRVKTYPMDAWKFLKDTSAKYDLIIIDFPDPTYDQMEEDEFIKERVNPLYGCRFYSLALKHLKKGGLLSIQVSGSPIIYNRVKDCLKKLGVEKIGKERGINFEQYFLYGKKE